MSEQDLQAEPLLEVFCVGFLVLTSFIVVFLPISVCDGKKILSEKKISSRFAFRISLMYTVLTMKKMTEKKKLTARTYTRNIVFIALFTALICVCAWITIPSAIPFTLQLFAIFLTLGLLGGKKGTIAVACYILLGLVGAPVFSGFKGGIAALSGVTGGYIVGFVFSALVYWGFTALFKEKFWSKIVAMFLGLIVCYAFGTAWFVFVKGSTSSPTDFSSALMLCVVPFIVFDVVKILLAAFLTRVLEPHLHLSSSSKKRTNANAEAATK